MRSTEGADSGIMFGIAAHEGDEFAVGNDLHDVAGKQRAAAVAALRPVQHGAAGEVTAAADQRDAGRQA